MGQNLQIRDLAGQDPGVRILAPAGLFKNLDSGPPQNNQADLSILRVYQLSLAILEKKLEIGDLAFHDLGVC